MPVTKADIARELEKVSAGVYRLRVDPDLVAELQEGRGFRFWRLSYKGTSRGSHFDREHDLDGVVRHFRRCGRCPECHEHAGTEPLRDWTDRHGLRAVCQRCHRTLERERVSFECATQSARLAGARYDLAVACVQATVWSQTPIAAVFDVLTTARVAP